VVESFFVVQRGFYSLIKQNKLQRNTDNISATTTSLEGGKNGSARLQIKKQLNKTRRKKLMESGWDQPTHAVRTRKINN
jgi:hypothetical protein